MAYVALWKKQLQNQGVKEGLLFKVTELKSESVMSVKIDFMAVRRASGGRLLPDYWMASFNPRGQAPNRRWVLVSLQAVRGDLNSLPPAQGSQRRRDLQEMTRDLPRIELPRPVIELPKP